MHGVNHRFPFVANGIDLSVCNTFYYEVNNLFKGYWFGGQCKPHGVCQRHVMHNNMAAILIIIHIFFPL